MTTACATERWVQKRVRIKFTFGNFLLFRKRFDALVLDGYWGDFGTDSELPAAPLQDFPASVRASLVNSHPVEQRLPRISRIGDSIRYAPSQYRRYYAELSGTFEDYLQSLSRNRRAQSRRTVRQFAAAGGGSIDWREYKHPHEMAEYHRLAREISRKTYQENLLDAGMPDGEEYFAKLMQMAEHGAVRGYILFLHDKAVAYQHCPVEGDSVVYERIGYDPAFRELQPGFTLLYVSLEHLFRKQEFRRFDFGKGDFPYKESVSTGFLQCADIYHFRRTPANYAVVLGHTALDTVWQGIARVLDRLHLRDRLKRIIRQHYGSRS